MFYILITTQPDGQTEDCKIFADMNIARSHLESWADDIGISLEPDQFSNEDVEIFEDEFDGETYVSKVMSDDGSCAEMFIRELEEF